jgi:hypothetical protein
MACQKFYRTRPATYLDDLIDFRCVESGVMHRHTQPYGDTRLLQSVVLSSHSMDAYGRWTPPSHARVRINENNLPGSDWSHVKAGSNSSFPSII